MKIYIRESNKRQYKGYYSSFCGINDCTSKTLKAGKVIKSQYTKEQWIIDRVEYNKELKFFLTKIR